MSGTTLPFLTGIQAPKSLEVIENDFTNIAGYCTQAQAATAGGGSVSLGIILNIATWILALTSDWNVIIANPTLTSGVVALVQNNYANTGITAQSFVNGFNAATALLTAIEKDYPTNGATPAVLIDRTWSSTAGPQFLTKTAAQLPNTVPAIAAFLATLS